MFHPSILIANNFHSYKIPFAAIDINFYIEKLPMDKETLDSMREAIKVER
jgi:hypothetical protein